MKIKRIKAKDFLTYEKLDYSFSNKPLMIQGLNLTDENQKSNGSGKSSIQAVIEFCITGDNSRGVRDIELVRFGCKESFLDLYATCNTRKEELHISWHIKKKGSNILNIKKKNDNSEFEEVSFSNVNDGKKYILQWFAISKDDLFNYFIINKSRFKSFFKSSNKEKVELINRFSDASIIEGIEELSTLKLDNEYKSLNDNILKNVGKIEVLEESLYRQENRDIDEEYKGKILELDKDNLDINESISEVEEEVKTEYQKIIDTKSNILKKEQEKNFIKAKSLPLNKQINSLEENFSELNRMLKNAQDCVNEFEGTDFEKKRSVFKDEISTIKESILREEQNVRKLKDSEDKVLKMLSNISIKLSGTITCPSCSFKFLTDSETPLEEIKRKEVSAKQLHDTILSKKDTVLRGIEILSSSASVPENKILKVNEEEEKEILKKSVLLKEVHKVNELINKKNEELNSLKQNFQRNTDNTNACNTEISRLQNLISKFEQNINNLKSEIVTLNNEILANNNAKKNLKKEDNEREILKIKEDIIILEDKNKLYEKKSKELSDKVYSINQWKNNFKQFKNHIANKSLEVMEFNTNRFLKGMGSDLVVKYEGYKTLANGTVKDDISATIIRDTERTFGSFSGGEQAKLIFSSILANRHLINLSHPFGGLDFLSIDEVFESLDSEGFKSLFEEVKLMQSNVMLITHVTFDDAGEDILTIIKENGISRIEE